LRYFPVLSPILYWLALLIFLPFYLAKIRPDFVITDPSTAPSLVWQPFLSRVLKFKTVLDIRSTPVAPGIRANIYFDFSVWITKTMFNGMTIVTPMMRDEICRKFHIDSDWVGILSNGISDEFLTNQNEELERDKLRRKLGLFDRFVVLYHGSFRPKGGLIESIKAMSIVKKEHPDIVLFLLGYGSEPFLKLLKETIRENNLEESVLLEGPVDYGDVHKYISISDVGLVPLPDIPDWRNQQPNKLLEYLAMKKVVVVSVSPAHQLVLDNHRNAIYVSHVVPTELAEAIERAYHNRDRLAEWGEIGRDIVVEKYTWDRVNEDFMTYLLRVRSGENGRSTARSFEGHGRCKN
jgi:glycosyltransferase involved in cell wall biosynthesis